MSSKWHANHIDWKTPTIMLSSFMVGIAFAVAHHLFYQSLDGMRVSGTSFSQQVNTGIGTAFAFLVRAALVLSIGVAYHQVFWRTIRTQSLSVSSIDTLASLLTALQEFVSVRTLYKHPVMVILALLSWTVPFAAIVPPATLSVHASPTLLAEYINQYLPTINFNGSAFNDLDQYSKEGTMSLSWGGYTMGYNGPSISLIRLTTATTSQGSAAPIPPPAVNSSYTAEMFAPSLQCQSTSPKIMDGFADSLGCAVVNDVCVKQGVGVSLEYLYLSWTPSQSALVPFDNSSVDANQQLKFMTSPKFGEHDVSFIGSYSDEPLTLFVATRPIGGFMDLDPAPWSVLNCSLYNSPTKVEFNYTNGLQQLRLVSREYLTAIPRSTDVYGYNSIGGQSTTGQNFSEGYYTVTPQPAVSYQAMMEALGRIVVGSISLLSGPEGQATFTDITSVMSTNLAYTTELVSIYGNISMLTGPVQITSRAPRALSEVMEELFFNITMSLYGTDQFLDLNSSFPTNVTIYTPYNIYVYSWNHLVLAYGLAIFATLIAVLVGSITLIANGLSYSNKFSTILRTTRGAAIDAAVSLGARDGADPLPKEIGKWNVRLGPAVTSQVMIPLNKPADFHSTVWRRSSYAGYQSSMISDEEE